VFTRALHWFLSWARSVQSTPLHSVSLRSILIPSKHLLSSLPMVSFVLYFLPVSYMHSCSPHLCYMPCPSNHPWLDHSTYIWILSMPFSQISCHLISFRSEYSQHPVFKHPQPVFLPLMPETKFHTHTEHLRVYVYKNGVWKLIYQRDMCACLFYKVPINLSCLLNWNPFDILCL
jgi:hypothetical protein